MMSEYERQHYQNRIHETRFGVGLGVLMVVAVLGIILYAAPVQIFTLVGVILLAYGIGYLFVPNIKLKE